MIRRFLAVVLVLVVAACAGTGAVVTPDTPREKLAASEIVYETVLKEVRSLTIAGIITPGSDLADGIARSITEARAVLDLWQADPDSPNYLGMANSALLGVQRYLVQARAGAQGAMSTETMSLAYWPSGEGRIAA